MNRRTSCWQTTGARIQRGQGVVEFLVAIGVFGAFLLGIFQTALLYRAKTTVDYAAFMAARAGSMNGASMSSMKDGLVKGLMPLYATEPDAAGLLKAYGKAKAAALIQARIKVISPTVAMFNQVAKPQFDGVRAIPNDDLAYRDPATRAANILKIKVTYDYPLIVPVIDKVVGRLFGVKRPVIDVNGKPQVMYVLPIQAQAVVNMQSPIRDANALASGNGGGNNGGGNGGGGSNPSPPPGTGGGDGNPPPNPPPGGGIPPPPTPPFACPGT